MRCCYAWKHSKRAPIERGGVTVLWIPPVRIWFGHSSGGIFLTLRPRQPFGYGWTLMRLSRPTIGVFRKRVRLSVSRLRVFSNFPNIIRGFPRPAVSAIRVFSDCGERDDMTPYSNKRRYIQTARRNVCEKKNNNNSNSVLLILPMELSE